MIYVIGFLAQVFFSARILLQWILSERAKSDLSGYFLAVEYRGFLPVICIWVVEGWLCDYSGTNHILLYLYLEFGQKASMEEITVYHPDVIAFDPGGGNFIHA